MADKSINLGGATYSVPRLNIGQYEQLDELWKSGIKDVELARKMAEIIFSRADPKIDDVKALECTPVELQRASTEIMKFSGLSLEQNSGEAPAAEGPASIN